MEFKILGLQTQRKFRMQMADDIGRERIICIEAYEWDIELFRIFEQMTSWGN